MKPDSPLVSYAYESDSYGGFHSPNVACIHGVECPLKPGYAKSLIGPAWFGGPAETSTHYLVGPDDICQGVPENRIAWHCGNGNKCSIALEQCGYAWFSEAEWNTSDGLKQQEHVSALMADVNRRNPLIRLKWLSDVELGYALRNPGTPGGIVTHDQMRRVMGGTTHYDPFNAPNLTISYPLARVISRAVDIRGGKPEPEGIFMALNDQQQADLLRYVTDIAGKVSFLYGNEVIPNGDGILPYSKTAANFNDTRDVKAVVDSIKGVVDWFNQNETIQKEDGSGAYPFTKTAANFNDVRAIADLLEELSVKVTKILESSAPKS